MGKNLKGKSIGCGICNERMAFIKLHFKNHRIIIQQECTIYKPKNISVYADMRKGVVDQKCNV